MDNRHEELVALIKSLGQVAVAFSGGVDSTVVAKAAQLALGDKAVALTADSPSVARSELADAKNIAALIGIRHRIIETEEFTDGDYVRNDGSRCYHCKSELYTQIRALLPEIGGGVIVSGANLDDLGDYRPGLVAAAENEVRHPLQELGFRKTEVRDLARFWQLPNWDKPAAPCLSSRLAPGVTVSVERTARIERAEELLKQLGLRECRVRLHEGELARIEVPPEAISRLTEPETRAKLTEAMRAMGFQFITIDLEGFRSGSMNHLVELNVRKAYSLAPGKGEHS